MEEPVEKFGSGRKLKRLNNKRQRGQVKNHLKGNKPEDFVDEFGNSVSAVSMNDENWSSLSWCYQTDLKIYDPSNFGEIAMGDVNHDETVNILDVTSMVYYLLGNIDYNDAQQLASDINFDETTNILDVVAIVQFILGTVAYQTLYANYIWTFFIEHVNGVITGANDVINIVNPTVGFKAFVHSNADARIFFIPSPDGISLLSESQSQTILNALNSNLLPAFASAS